VRIRTIVIAASCALVLVATLSMGASLTVKGKLEAANAESVTMLSAMRNHMTGDMFHDGLRGIVYQGLYAQKGGDNATLQARVVELKEMSAEFRDAIAAQNQLSLPEDVRISLNAVATPLDEYISLAALIMDQAAAGKPDEAASHLTAFGDKFSALEAAMESVSEKLEESNKTSQAHAAGVARLSNQVTIGMFLLQIILCVGLVIAAVRAVAAPITRLSDSMRRLASNDLSAAVNPNSPIDELRTML
jgi:methyl-accepting chemotaxis protein